MNSPEALAKESQAKSNEVKCLARFQFRKIAPIAVRRVSIGAGLLFLRNSFSRLFGPAQRVHEPPQRAAVQDLWCVDRVAALPAGSLSLPLGQKDNRLMLAAADARGVALPLASLVHDRFLAVRSQGIGAEHDSSALALCALAEAGLAKPA